MRGDDVKSDCKHGRSVNSQWMNRLLVWVFFVVTVAGTLAYWYLHDVQPHRVPPVWDETCYMHGTLTAYETFRTSWQAFLRLFVDHDMCVSHRTFLGSLFTVPLLLSVGIRCEVFFLASVLMTGVGAILIAWAAYVASGRDAAACIGGVIAGWYFLLAPMTLGCAAMYYSEAPLAVALPASIVAYLLARERDSLVTYVIASIILFSCLYVRAERGLPCIAMMMVVYCVDEWRHNGWRAARDAVYTMIGLGTLSLLALQGAVKDWKTTTTLSLLANMAGVMVVLFCASYWMRPSPATRRSLAYALPVWTLLMLWFAYQTNASQFFTVLKMFLDRDAAAPRLFSYPFAERFIHRYSGTVMSGYVKLVLLGIGLVVAGWRWPGLIALIVMAILSIAKLNVGVGARYLYQFHILAAVSGGLAVSAVARWLGHRCETLPEILRSLMLLGLCGLFLCSQMPGLFRLARKTFEGQDCTYWIMFDKEKTYWRILEAAGTQVASNSCLALFPTLHALDNGSFRLYGKLAGLNWSTMDLTLLNDTIQPLHENERARGIWPQHVVVPELKTTKLYGRLPTLAEVEHVRHLLERGGEYELGSVESLSGDAGKVYVFNRKNKGE